MDNMANNDQPNPSNIGISSGHIVNQALDSKLGEIVDELTDDSKTQRIVVGKYVKDAATIVEDDEPILSFFFPVVEKPIVENRKIKITVEREFIIHNRNKEEKG